MEARAATFRQCLLRTYEFATAEGQRGCHYNEGPYLPEELDVRCPTCLYNVSGEDGNPDCGDPPDCAFARRLRPTGWPTLRLGPASTKHAGR